jgi:hypothetical protein
MEFECLDDWHGRRCHGIERDPVGRVDRDHDIRAVSDVQRDEPDPGSALDPTIAIFATGRRAAGPDRVRVRAGSQSRLG